MMPIPKRFLIPLLVIVCFPSVRAEVDRVSSTIILDDTGVANLNLETVAADEQRFETTIFALGRIGIDPIKRAVVSSRILGRASALFVKPDLEIAAGEELIKVESRQAGNPPPTVTLTAPISGMVIRINTSVGQPVSPDDSLIEIADLSYVHASASVPEYLAGKLSIGQIAHISLPAYPDKFFDAPLAHISALADAGSGTVDAVFHVENPDRLLRPGMRAEFSIVTGARENVMTIPRTAVQGDATNRFVYIKDPELKNAFIKGPIVTGDQNEEYVEVVSGLFPGDEVVTRGAYSLAFAGKGNVSLKEALDAAHGHAHNEDGSEMTEDQHAEEDGHDHGDHPHSEGGFGRLTTFFAGTTLFFMVLLILSLFARKPNA